jgi:hypothetical protein
LTLGPYGQYAFQNTSKERLIQTVLMKNWAGMLVQEVACATQV